MLNTSKLILLATTAMLVIAAPVVASAQTADDGKLETVIVTARKRSEDLLKIPVAVSAFTSADIAVRGIVTLDDLSNFTPGLTDDQSTSGGVRTDRSFQQLIIRGMNPSSTLNPTTSVFINGVAVGAADFLQNLDDVDRVEVLKGPQSAYFGRETFAGAINVIPKAAGDTFTANASAEVGGRRTEIFSGTINMPIIADRLSIRAGYTYDHHDGSYKNADNPGQTLGDQTTKTVHIAITARPIDNLTIKGFGEIFQDDDGPAATGVLIATGAGAFNQGNCSIQGTPFFCGTLPGLISSVSPAQITTISQTLNFANATQSFFKSPGGIIRGDDLVNHFGLKRNAYHGDINVEYDIPNLGLSLTYLGGFDHQAWSEVSDLGVVDGLPNGQYPGYTGFPFEVQDADRDISHEFRIATDQKKPYRALLGFSYVDSYHNSGLGLAFIGPNQVNGDGATKSVTTGVFFSLAYDILPQLTLSFDGRYQQDKESAYDQTGALIVAGTTSDFLPRASIQYRFTPDMMTYFTYSKGVNPGTFNTQFSTLPTASQQDLTALGIAGQTVVKPEDLTNYEIGFKGRFFGGRATLSADIYYDKWTNQLDAVEYFFSPSDPGNPYNVNVPGNNLYVPNNTSTFPYSYTDNAASSTAKGLEVEADFIPIEHLTVTLAGAINDTQYDEFICTTCLPYDAPGGTPGFNAKGKYLPNAPKDTFTGSIEYASRAMVLGASDWFVRGDFIYKDGVYIQPDNFAKTPDVELVNIRAGLSWPHFSVEGFVNNLFNNKSYTSGAEDPNFAGGFTPTEATVGLPQLITAGVKFKYKY